MLKELKDIRTRLVEGEGFGGFFPLRKEPTGDKAFKSSCEFRHKGNSVKQAGSFMTPNSFLLFLSTNDQALELGFVRQQRIQFSVDNGLGCLFVSLTAGSCRRLVDW